jgi:hypothetical protein
MTRNTAWVDGLFIGARLTPEEQGACEYLHSALTRMLFHLAHDTYHGGRAGPHFDADVSYLASRLAHICRPVLERAAQREQVTT